MKLTIQDREALSAISPSALSAVALTLGWRKVDAYGDNSDVYSGNDLPEIVIPRIKELGDYSTVVSRLVGIFAKVTDKHELAIYKDLSSVDQDVVRVRIPSGDDGTLAMDGGVKLFKDIRDPVLAAARSLKNPQPVYHGRADSDAANLLKRVRLGQTEQGSYVVTLLVKITPPPQQELSLAIESNNVPIERKYLREPSMTERMHGLLSEPVHYMLNVFWTSSSGRLQRLFQISESMSPTERSELIPRTVVFFSIIIPSILLKTS